MKRKYLILILAVVLIAAVVYATHDMWGGKGKAAPVALNKPPSATPGAIVEAKSSGPGFDIAYEPLKVKASVKPYTVKADLSNVVNWKEFGKFTAEQKALLAKNSFYAAPTDEQQLFFIYEQNDYKNVPSFITTDSVLQVYHIFYDFTLRNLESGKLYDVLGTLADSMIEESKSVGAQMKDPKWKEAAAMNEVYFAVPASLLGRKVQLSPAKQRDILTKEINLVNKAPGRVMSALFPWKPDYSQFIPRGHYTRSDKLKKFFKAMMWYGYMPFPADAPDVGAPTGFIKGGPAWPQMRQAILWTKMLFDTEIGGKPAIETWEHIYQPTAFYVGVSDDLTPHQFKAIMDRVYGKDADYSNLQDEAKLKKVYAELTKLPRPRIDVMLQEMPNGVALKFMGQRYIPDSEIMQRLVSWPERPFPKGLDVMAVLGSTRAADILDNMYKEPLNWSEYLPERNKLVKEFKAVPDKTWRSNLYWGWMWGLDSLLDTFGEGYPSFMRNQAWADKSLNTSLGSWAELRHDTILYAKQSGIECGGDGEPPPPKSYVEPNVEFYSRLLWLTKASRSGLKSRGLLTDEMTDKFSQFEDLLTFLRDISVKELTNKKISEEEYYRMKVYGADLEILTLSVIEGGASNWYEITSEADKDMALVADVHTSQDKCLEEAVGRASEIYVVVPIEGKLYLTRGAIFSYYEFQHPSSNRLTDEAWQKMLKTGGEPPLPAWMRSFLNGAKRTEEIPKEGPSPRC